MTATNEVLEERIKHLTSQVQAATSVAQKARTDLEEFEKAVEAREKKRLMTGISVLGSIVLSLVGIIWSYRSVIFK